MIGVLYVAQSPSHPTLCVCIPSQASGLVSGVSGMFGGILGGGDDNDGGGGDDDGGGLFSGASFMSNGKSPFGKMSLASAEADASSRVRFNAAGGEDKSGGSRLVRPAEELMSGSSGHSYLHSWPNCHTDRPLSPRPLVSHIHLSCCAPFSIQAEGLNLLHFAVLPSTPPTPLTPTLSGPWLDDRCQRGS